MCIYLFHLNTRIGARKTAVGHKDNPLHFHGVSSQVMDTDTDQITMKMHRGGEHIIERSELVLRIWEAFLQRRNFLCTL